MKKLFLLFLLVSSAIGQTSPVTQSPGYMVLANGAIVYGGAGNGTLTLEHYYLPPNATLEIPSGGTIKADPGSTVTGFGSAPFNISNFTLNGFLAGNGTGVATIIAPVNNNIIGWNGTGVATAFPFNSTTVNTTLGALATLNTLPWALLTGTPTTAAGYGITHGSLLDSFGGITTYSSSGLGLLSIGANVSASNLIATALFLNSAEPLATMNVTNGSKLDGLASNLTGITGNVPVANVNAGTMQGGMTIPSGTFSGSISGTLNGGVALNAQTLSGNGTFSGVLTDSNATLNFTGLTGNGILSLNGTGKLISTALTNGQIPYWTGGAPTALTINSTTVNATLGNLATANASGNLAITGGNLDIIGNLAALSHNLTASGNVPAANVGNGTLGAMNTTTPLVNVRSTSLATTLFAFTSQLNNFYYAPRVTDYTSVVTGSGSTANSAYNVCKVETGATLNSTALLKIQTSMLSPTTTNFAILNFSNPLIMRFMLNDYFLTTNITSRITFGKANADGTGALVNLGFGFEFDGVTAYGATYMSGTQTLTALSGGPLSTGAIQTSHSYLCAIYSDGAGNVYFYMNGALVGSTSTGPTGNSVANPLIQAEIVNANAGFDAQYNISMVEIIIPSS